MAKAVFSLPPAPGGYYRFRDLPRLIAEALCSDVEPGDMAQAFKRLEWEKDLAMAGQSGELRAAEPGPEKRPLRLRAGEQLERSLVHIEWLNEWCTKRGLGCVFRDGTESAAVDAETFAAVAEYGKLAGALEALGFTRAELDSVALNPVWGRELEPAGDAVIDKFASDPEAWPFAHSIGAASVEHFDLLQAFARWKWICGNLGNTEPKVIHARSRLMDLLAWEEAGRGRIERAAQGKNNPELAQASPPEEVLKRSALIRELEHEWPTIEADLRDASRNGLTEAAHAAQFGKWKKEAALAWARSQGKLRASEDPRVLALRNTPFPGRVHRIK